MAKSKTAKAQKIKKPAQRGARKARINAGKTVGATQPKTRKEREPTKKRVCIDLLSRPDGASTEELQQATGWQAHSVRGFLAGTVKKKLGLTLVSDKPADGPRRYRIMSAEA
jgi:hypothetical protein